MAKARCRLLLKQMPRWAWQALNTHEAILESFVDFAFEISVLVWRDADGLILFSAGTEPA